MNCPVCKSCLHTARTPSAEVNVCPQCNGIWFSDGRLPNFIDALVASNKIKPRKIKLFAKRHVQNIFTVNEKKRICPQCNTS